MDQISSRALFSTLAGTFALALGLFALIQNHRYRLNRMYAAYMLSLAALLMPFTMYFADKLGHQTALFSYRVLQFALPVSSYFLICFLQEYAGIFDEKRSIILRRIVQIVFVVLAPLYLTPFFIRDFTVVPQGNDLQFVRQTGPLFSINILMYLGLMTMAAVTTISRLRSSTGLKQNQMRFVAAGLGLGFLSAFFYFLSFNVVDLPWLYHPLQMAMNFCFAFAIFKYQLFEFDVWMGRVLIYIGVYLTVISVPFFLFFPFRSVIPVGQSNFWIVLATLMISYGILFALAPLLTSYLRNKTEKKKLGYLQQQLETVRESSEHLMDESGLAVDEIARRILHSFKNFYWERMNTPLKFIFIVLLNKDDRLSSASYPLFQPEEGVLREFLLSLKSLPAEFLKQPFSFVDIEKQFQARAETPRLSEFRIVKKYLLENQIEVCAPCVDNNRLMGVILLGPKHRGILWREELNTVQLAASHVAIAVRKSELITHNQELRDLDRLKTELIHNITHEFKTPLQVVENAMEILMKDVKKGQLDSKKVGDYLLMVKNNAGMLAMFIQNLLEVSRIEQSKVDLKPRRADLNEVVQSAIEFVKPLADQKNVAIEFSPNGPLRLTADVEKLQQVFCNLLSNAVKFTDHGRIQIQLESKGESIGVRVQDTGRGIEPRHLGSIFEKFFQVPTEEHLQKEGTGLGLAIAKGWVEAHGGTIRAESAGLGQGTTFILTIPLMPPFEQEFKNAI